MHRLVLLLMMSGAALVAGDVGAQSKLPKCPGAYDAATWTNCFGETTRPSGLVFAAEFRNGKPNGQGTSISPNGDRYVGEFRDGTQHGKGTMTWKNMRYAGDWRDGKMHGIGTLTGHDGSKYVGEFKDNKMHGQVTEYRPDGSVERSGTWRNGDFVKSR